MITSKHQSEFTDITLLQKTINIEHLIQFTSESAEFSDFISTNLTIPQKWTSYLNRTYY